MDESESGEAYEKIAGQTPRLPSKESRHVRRQHRLSLTLEARLVRDAMLRRTTVDRLAKKLGLKPSIVKYHLKRLGLDNMVSTKSTIEAHRTHRSKRTRRTLVKVWAGRL